MPVRRKKHHVIWANTHGPIPSGFDVHHKNGNHADNRLENLELLPHAEHTRLTHAGRTFSDEHRRKLSTALKGRPAWNKGRPCSQESRHKMSEAHKGSRAWNKGIKDMHFSPRTEFKKGFRVSPGTEFQPGIRNHPDVEITAGEHRSPDTEFKIGMMPWNKGLIGHQVAWNKGCPWSEESRRKMSEAAKHRPPITEETRHKLSEAQQRRYHPNK